MAKNLNMSLLLDFYGDILPEKQREAMELFYNGDYSLSEISEETGITRQGVRDRIVKGEATVTGLEERLGLAERFGRLRKTAIELDAVLDTLEKDGVDVGRVRELTKKIIELGG
jgi:predicted DNA-binding protein YlxM (UPF0122 family)